MLDFTEYIKYLYIYEKEKGKNGQTGIKNQRQKD